MTNPALPVINTSAGASGASSRGSHQLACVDECETRWRFRYRDRITPKKEPEFRIGGTLHHDALAHAYAERMMDMVGTTPTWWDGRTVQQVLEEHGEGWPQLIRNSIEVYEEYPRHWWAQTSTGAGLRENWIPIAVEEEFKARVGDIDPAGCDGEYDDEIVTCRSDLVVRDKRTGAIIIVDHKTKSPDYKTGRLPAWNPGGEYRVSWQAAINLLLVRHSFPGELVAGFVVNRVTRKPPFDYDRHLLRVSNLMYQQTPGVIRAQVKAERRLDNMLASGEPLKHSYWNCFGRFGDCDYIDVCDAGTPEDAEAVIAQNFTSRT